MCRRPATRPPGTRLFSKSTSASGYCFFSVDPVDEGRKRSRTPENVPPYNSSLIEHHRHTSSHRYYYYYLYRCVVVSSSVCEAVPPVRIIAVAVFCKILPLPPAVPFSISSLFLSAPRLPVRIHTRYKTCIVCAHTYDDTILL